MQVGVGHGLAAAGLGFGEVNVEAEAFEHVDGCQADFGVELVDVAGDDDVHAHMVIVFQSCREAIVCHCLLHSELRRRLVQHCSLLRGRGRWEASSAVLDAGGPYCASSSGTRGQSDDSPS